MIQTFVELIKRNTADRQIVLVNTAQALKHLEAYGQRQAQLFTVFEKYHQVPDCLEDLKSQFHSLKEATSRNIENLQQVINLPQTYPAALCSHVNVIFSRLTKLEADIQNLTEKFKTEQEDVQIDAPDFEIADRDWHDTSHPITEDSHPPADTPGGPQQAALTEHNTFDEIPQLEEEEDWENGQLADTDTNLINKHNTYPESE